MLSSCFGKYENIVLMYSSPQSLSEYTPAL